MPRWFSAALILLGACSGQPTAESRAPAADEGPSGSGAVASEQPPRDATAPWLRTLLAVDLEALPTDERATALGEQLGAPVTCPMPGTGCFVELPLAGFTTKVHLADDQAIQVWGPNEPMRMPQWVEGVEAEIDRSSLTALNPPGTRPDRLWRSPRRVVLLHDHSLESCDGFCPAMIWISVPEHPSARGYGFRDAN